MRFSQKQRRVLTWWCRPGDWEAIICDGAVRSGKTFSMGLSFFLWAMARFNGRQLGLCGKTITSLRRNLLAELVPYLRRLGFDCWERRSENLLTVRLGGHEKPFPALWRAGRVQRGADPGQHPGGGAAGRGGPDAPELCGAGRRPVQRGGEPPVVQLQSGEPSALVLPRVDFEGAGTAGPVPSFHHGGQPRPVAPDPARYRSAYSGIFYRRFVLGEWTAAQGRVYDFFDRDRDSVPVPEGDFQEWRISVDYGTANPASFGLWGRQGEIWYRVGEFYYDSRREGRQKTDAEYVRDLRELAEGREITRVIVDPSAASFIEALRREGFRVVRADNDVADGIRVTADLLKRRRIVICGACADCLREMETYCWDDKGRRDAPKKEQDHAMDDLRYFAMDLAAEEQNGFAATWVERRA